MSPTGHATPHSASVAIVGAGFSGTMVAVHLLRTLPAGHVIHLLDGSGRFARGPAYAATQAPYLLNVRAGSMGALAGDPGHFERWMQAQDASRPGGIDPVSPGAFATRRLYGRYLRAVLAEEMRRHPGRLLLHADTVEALHTDGAGWTLHCSTGRTLATEAVVMALGNLPGGGGEDGVVFHNPWDPKAVTGLNPEEPVLIVGTGLTMVDLAIGLTRHGFGGCIQAISRRGLLPHIHGAPQPAFAAPHFTEAERRSVAGLLRVVRRHVRQARAEGVDWRAVIDGLRPVTSSLWQGLPVAERRRFLRHLRPYWDAHRHRMPPASAANLAELTGRGALRVRRGRIRRLDRRAGCAGADVAVEGPRGALVETMTVQRVIHATGPGALRDGLMGSMVQAGLAIPDALGLGLQVTGTLAVPDAAGDDARGLWALGPVVRGVFWECTAVPDIRVQAADVAEAVRDYLVARQP